MPRHSGLPRFALMAIFLAAAFLTAPGARAPVANAMPAHVWVINDNVAAAMAGVSPASFDSALTGNSATRLPYISQFGAYDAASGGQVALTSAIPYAGNVFIVVQTDGSPTGVQVNGRGLTCTPACDAATTATPDAIDHIVVYQVTGTGTHSIGDALFVDALQDAVSLTARTITIVGQATNITLSVARTTIQGGLASCSVTDNAAAPQRTPALATYTDVNNTPLVGYNTNWSSTLPSHLLVGAGVTASMVQVDGLTVAARNVACGVAVGSSDVQAANAISGAIQGFATVTRSQTVIVTDASVPPSPAMIHASSGGTTTTFEATLNGGMASAQYQVDLFSSPSCGAVSGNTHVGTFQVATDAGGNFKLYAIASSAVTPGWVVQATATDPNVVTSPLSGCQAVGARACANDTTCNGYTDAQKIALNKDPFTYCGVMRADINTDGKVTLGDLILMAQKYNQTIPPAPARYDQNADNKINLTDLIMEAQVYNQSVTVCP